MIHTVSLKNISKEVKTILGLFFILIITTILLLLLSTQTTYAAEIKEVSSNDELLFNISASDLTRISVPNDKIQSLQFTSHTLEVQKDNKLGEAYIKPKNIDAPISLFITTKKGFVYKLLLMPEEIPSAQIILENKNTYISSKVSGGATNNYERKIADIILAMQENIPLESCSISQDEKQVNSPIAHIKLKTTHKYLCNDFTGYKLIITKTEKQIEASTFREKDFVTSDTAGVKIHNNMLLVVNKNG